MILAQASDTTSSAAGGVALITLMLVYFAFVAVMIAAMWKIYAKAGQPGWAAIIPIYNLWVLLKIVGREPWWILLFLVPCVNIVAAVVVYLDLAKSFGKDTAYGIGLLVPIVNIVLLLMLGFGDARYVGPAGATGGGTGWGQPYQGQTQWTQPGQQQGQWGQQPQQGGWGQQQPGQPPQGGQWGQQPPQQGGWGQQQ